MPVNIGEGEAIQMVEGSRKQCEKRDQKRADVLRIFQHVAGFPSDETIIFSAKPNGVKNSPITPRDVDLAR